jgi:oligoendopeptidase F
MAAKLPKNTTQLMNMRWEDFEPLYQDLEKQEITKENVEGWLSEWSRVSECVDEQYNRLLVDTAANTADTEADAKMTAFQDLIFPNAQTHEQVLKQKLLATRLEPSGFDIPLRNMNAETKLFREENLPFQTEEQKLSTELDKIMGAQTTDWNGEEKTVYQLDAFRQNDDRNVRERAWKAIMARQYADRDAINNLWVKQMDLRQKMAQNAGKPDYRSYIWQKYYRFDYSPQDCMNFHQAIEQVVVPVVTKLLKRHQERLGVEILRPWDMDLKMYVDPFSRPPLKPFSDADEQIRKTQNIFNHVDPVLGGYFQQMISEKLADIPNRKNKAPGAFCTGYNLVRKPFIVCNSVGTQNDVSTLLHESGHAFHVFESAHLPYLQQLNVTMEFAEVASMGMELLASPYLGEEYGGFYTAKDAARALSEHLITSLLFWPYMSVVDSFQHWVYENPRLGTDPEQCDKQWSKLWDRFMPDQDWTGFEDFKKTGWHRKQHIHQMPFYYIEYGLAQLGAVQVWANALKNQHKAVNDYRRALAFGGTVPLPVLYRSAGAKLAFDAATLKTHVDLMLSEIERLDQIQA